MKITLLIPCLIFLFLVAFTTSCKKDKDNPDITAPVITLKGNPVITVAKDSVYVDAGATALDDVDGDITANISITSTVNINVVGDYTVRFNVSDAAGNASAEVSRTVKVRIL
jgi:hypothetical protein